MDVVKKDFYLGKEYDPEKGEILDQVVNYDPDDLTTHAVAVGMTGSGKTGLCIDLLEEAALRGIPALMIDPKGDMTNTLLHFPDLLPQDFQPWVDPDQARREGKSLDQAAQDAARLWKEGLQSWGISGERLEKLKSSAQFGVYTPGSEAGVPINILSSLKAPELPWEAHREVLREKISGTVMGLLGLVGLEEVDPVRSREHILLSNIFEKAWSKGRDLDLGELILQIQNPPFEKLGLMGVDAVIPEKDRMELAMMLNNILAAPGFQAWISGQPLAVEELLYTPEGQPRHTVLYLAHLSDAERMFFVTLLYSAVETWMRSQKGTNSLRALVYFDEIYGYLPPVANPPSKTPMLRMLKQARAFGVGQVLVTQNPVDVDYKALSNAGTWLIGKLQTEQDKNRLLEGLEGAAPGMEKDVYDRLISTLDKRVFLLHNVHEDQPRLFYTRWAMNYLRGPLTRNQIPALNDLAGIQRPAAGHSPAQGEQLGRHPVPSRPGTGEVESRGTRELPGSSTRPRVPAGADEYFFPVGFSLAESLERAGQSREGALERRIIYRPQLTAQAQVRFLRRKYNLDFQEQVSVLVQEPDRQGRVDWNSWEVRPLEIKTLEREARQEARFRGLTPPLQDSSTLSDLESDFKDWIYHTVTVAVRAQEELDLYAGPEVSPEDFQALAAEAARELEEEELAEINEDYEKKMDRVKDRLVKEERELKEDQTELSQRKMEEMGTHAENLLSLLAGRKRRVSSSLTKRRMTSKAKADVQESLEMIEEYQQEIIELEEERQQAAAEEREKWQELQQEIQEIPVPPYKKDIMLELFGVVWFPYYLVPQGQRWREVPAFEFGEG